MLNNCKYYKEKYQVSYDFGVTWLDTGNYRKGNLYEYQSSDCPVIFSGKWLATYSDSHTESAECDSTSAITSNEIDRSIVSVQIGDCVTNIDFGAFATCSGLTSATIGSNVTTIGINAFMGCSFSSITIPSSVTTISQWAFGYCSGLTSIDIPDTVTSLGFAAFDGCTNLLSANVGSGVTSIEGQLFGSCSSLTSVTIPNSVTSIGLSSFNGCTSLTSIDIPSGVTSIDVAAFENCRSLSVITIPNSVTIIGAYAFQNCSGLTSINIGSGVTSIGGYAFHRCSGLTSLTINAIIPPTLEREAFSDTNNCPIYVPCESVDAYKAASGWSNYASRIQGIPPCGEPQFDGKWLATYSGGTTSSAECDSTSAITNGEVTTTDLVDVLIGDCVTSIGNRAFWLCASLTSVTIGNGVTSIGSDAFYICRTLTSITIPNTVTTIGGQAFAACRSITSLTIPDSVTTIGNRAFGGCSGLTSCTIGSGVTSIGDSGFTDNASIVSITVNAITPPTLGSSVFDYTNNCPIYVPCESVDAYKAASGWSNYASRIQGIPPCSEPQYRTISGTPYCTGVDKYQDVYDQVSYDSGSTWQTTATTSVLIEAQSTDCGYVPPTPTFDGKFYATYTGGTTYSAACDSDRILDWGETRPNEYQTSTIKHVYMAEAIIGDCVTSIGSQAFRDCSRLTSVTIPNSVTSIGDSAFTDCGSLSSITVPSSVTFNGDAVFDGCSSLVTVTIPNLTARESIFRNCSHLTSIITGPNGVAGYGDNGIPDYAFYACRSLTSITLANDARNIGGEAFASCRSLSSITIPSGVRSIGYSAFAGCRNLQSITCLPTTPPSLESQAFYNTNNCPIYVPSQSVNAYKSAWSAYASRIQATP